MVRFLLEQEYPGQILEELKYEAWTTTGNNKNHNKEIVEAADDSPAVPPGSGLKRTQSRNARRKLARQHKQAKQGPMDQLQTRSDGSEEEEDEQEDEEEDDEEDDEETDENNSNSTSDSSSSDASNDNGDDSSSDSSDDSSDSSSSSDDDAPPTETFNVTHKQPQLYYDATTRQPYRVYRDRLELEAVEINFPGEFPLRVPAPSATTPFIHESIAAGTHGKRDHDPRIPFARPFNPAPYPLVPAHLAQLQRGQVIRFGMLAIKPGEMVPSFEPDLCALVLEVPAAAGSGGDDEVDGTVTVQLASKFISLEPTANRFAPTPPRYDYGVRELTSTSGISDLRVYEGAPALAIYPSMLFEAELDD